MSDKMPGSATKQRRQFLKQSIKATALVSGCSIVTPSLASALYAPTTINHTPDRKLKLINDHTLEKLDVVYWSKGEYLKDGLKEINHLLRDHRANKEIAMDVQLIENMQAIYSLLETKERIHVLSGYRTKETNQKLRSRSNQVAKYSLHMEGRAIDHYIPGTSTKQLQQAAISISAGGVGYYPSSGFVHIDTGTVRAWDAS